METPCPHRRFEPLCVCIILAATPTGPELGCRFGARLDGTGFTDLEARVRSVRAGRSDRERKTATALHALDLQCAGWLADRGLTVEAHPPRAHDCRICRRALARSCTAGQARGQLRRSRGAGVFYLGRVDVAVSGRADSPGVTSVDASDLRLFDAKTDNEAAEMARA